MNKWMKICMFSCLMHVSTTLFAGCTDFACLQQGGFFLGLGGSYNSVKFKQDYSAVGTGSVFDESNTLVATGNAGGPGAPFSETQTTFAPALQAGYYNYYGCTNSFWGLKFIYQYLDLTSTDTLLDTPQAGILEPQGGSMVEFTGNVITKSAQTKINHELALLAFIGHSFEKSKIYLGIGPCVFGTKSHIYQAFGFANLDGIPHDATGDPVSFSSTKWVWGGAAQLGLSCRLDPCWVLDINYMYAVTMNYNNHYSSPFITQSVGGIYTDIGTLFIDTKRQIRAQALIISINKSFP